MKLTLNQDGSIELSRGDRIVRGQNASKMLIVDWITNHSPAEKGLVSLDNFVVRINITRPNGEQSGWQVMHKVDNKFIVPTVMLSKRSEPKHLLTPRQNKFF